MTNNLALRMNGRAIEVVFRALRVLTWYPGNGEAGHRLVSWISEFEQWFSLHSGTGSGHNLHLMYGRGLNIVGVTHRNFSNANHVAASVSAMGVGVTFILDEQNLSLLKESEDAPFEFAMALVIELSHDGCNHLLIELLDMLPRSQHLTLIAPPVRILSGIFNTYQLNGRYVTIVPKQSSVDGWRPKSNFCRRECFGRLGLCISEDGNIYPCRSSYLARAHSFGDLSAPAADLMNSQFQLYSQWALFGPEIDSGAIGEDLCRLHCAKSADSVSAAEVHKS